MVVYVALTLAAFACSGRWLLALRGGTTAIAAPTRLQPPQPEPWTREQTVEPADLVRELAGAPGHTPTVVCVGFPSLYRAGHIPGASFHGPASSVAGLADLKAWAEPLPRSSDLVVYCGCCPLAACPNLHPAFSALREMGFTHLRVVTLPNNFATDWVGKGYPIEAQ
jgi:hypothetical protein